MNLEELILELKRRLGCYTLGALKKVKINIKDINEGTNFSELKSKVSSLPDNGCLLSLITEIESLKAANDECDFFDPSQFEVKNTGIQR